MKTKFKETEIGKIPEDWEVVEFRKIISGKPRHGLYKPEEYFGAGVKIIKMGVQSANEFIDSKNVPDRVKLTAQELERYRVFEKDLLFLRTSLVLEGTGKCSYARNLPEPTVFVSNLIAITLSDKSEPLFYFYYFKSPQGRDRILSLCEQTAASTIRSSELNKLQMPCPNKKEQLAIAKILSDLDSKIELNQAMNQTLEATAQALFKQWFIDFEFPNEKGKPYKSSGGKMVLSEELQKKIPGGWKGEQLSELLNSIESGRRPKGGINPNLNEGIPSIGAENINGLGYYNYNITKYISEAYFSQMKQGIIGDYDILLYKDGASLGRKTLFGLGFPFNTCCVNEHVFIIRANTKLNQLYLYFWFDQKEVTEDIKNLNANSAQPGINKNAVGSLTVLVPEKVVLNEFKKYVDLLIKNLFSNCLESRILSQLRDSLLPKLMSGKIRTPAGVE